MGAQVEGAVTDLADHVVVTPAGVGQLVVETVSYRHLSHHIKLLEQVQGAVDGGNVQVRVVLFGTAKYLVHSYMTPTLCYFGENQQALRGEPIPLPPKVFHRLVASLWDVCSVSRY